MVEVIDCEQNTQEWLEARLGVPTASAFHRALAKGRGDAMSVTAKKYAYELAAQLVTETLPDQWGNADTERGHEHEPVARELYGQKTGNKVEQVGFIKNGIAGYSPDGLLGDDGLVEFKSKKPELHLECLLEQSIPSEHMKQLYGGLWVSGRQWIDFVSYCPNLPLFVKRVERDEKAIAEIEDGIKRFNDGVQDVYNKIIEAY